MRRFSYVLIVCSCLFLLTAGYYFSYQLGSSGTSKIQPSQLRETEQILQPSYLVRIVDGKVVIQHQKIKEIIICLTCKAVYFLSFWIVSHGGVTIQMLRVQAVEPLGGVDSSFIEVIEDMTSKIVKVFSHVLPSSFFKISISCASRRTSEHRERKIS